MNQSPQHDPVSDLIAAAATHLVRGDMDSARAAMVEIDQPKLVILREADYRRVWGPGGIASGLKRPKSQPRRSVGLAAKQRVFRRDHFTCRYAHCRRRTIDVRVLRAISQAMPDVLPYNRNWRPVSAQILYWVYAASLEHYRSRPHAGSSEERNLLTACYACNDLKNWLAAEALGWTVVPPGQGKWDGLEGLLPQLRARGLAV